MKSLLIAAAFSAALSVTSFHAAADSSTINQAGAYEQTMQFYLHPALGFSRGSAQIDNHPGVLAHAAARSEPIGASFTHPALTARDVRDTDSDRLARRSAE